MKISAFLYHSMQEKLQVAGSVDTQVCEKSC